MAERQPRSLRAPAKLNLGLRVGPAADDGLHAIRSLFCPLELSDRIVVVASETEADEVVCEGVEGPNLAADALRALREAGWSSAPLRAEIEKRIPVAAGLGGGSADAAALLRLAAGEVDGIERIAFALGSDVPSQLQPAPCIVGGRGESVNPVDLDGSAGVVLIPADRELRAADVYAKADELGIGAAGEAPLVEWEAEVRRAIANGGRPLAASLDGLLVNDLEPAVIALAPEAGEALEALGRTGAGAAFVCGSGPTVAGLFADLPAADQALAALGPRYSTALVTALDTNGRA